jgi:hypothetical protein
MKKVILTIGLTCGLAGIALADSYGEGWEAGWKHKHGDFSIVPICPLSPLPPLGHDTYQDGFLDGAAAAENS